MGLRFYCPPDDPAVTECCGALFVGDYIVGELCPACGKQLPIPEDYTEEQDDDTRGEADAFLANNVE